jgi:hypothetical protein
MHYFIKNIERVGVCENYIKIEKVRVPLSPQENSLIYIYNINVLGSNFKPNGYTAEPY